MLETEITNWRFRRSWALFAAFKSIKFQFCKLHIATRHWGKRERRKPRFVFFFLFGASELLFLSCVLAFLVFLFPVPFHDFPLDVSTRDFARGFVDRGLTLPCFTEELIFPRTLARKVGDKGHTVLHAIPPRSTAAVRQTTRRQVEMYAVRLLHKLIVSRGGETCQPPASIERELSIRASALRSRATRDQPSRLRSIRESAWYRFASRCSVPSRVQFREDSRGLARLSVTDVTFTKMRGFAIVVPQPNEMNSYGRCAFARVCEVGRRACGKLKKINIVREEVPACRKGISPPTFRPCGDSTRSLENR